MKNILKIGLISLNFLLINIANPVLAKSTEEQIKETGIVKVGIIKDNPLFGFGEDNSGYCADFAQQLVKKLSQNYGKNIQLEIITSTLQNRWDQLREGIVHLNCGPNTITKEREEKYQVFFSEPFFYTATQIFTRNGIEEQTLRDGQIGVVPNTTNESDLKQIYSEAHLKTSYNEQTHGIADVLFGTLTGFASDGIILMGTAVTMEVNLSKYTLVTPLVNNRPFCAEYGMILPGGEENKSWRNIVNEEIASNNQDSETWNTWFGESLPYINAVLKACK